MKISIGVIHGRFQPFHYGHLEYALAAHRLSELLIVGITNPYPDLTEFDPIAPSRTAEGANPLTFFDRVILARAALFEAGVDPKDVICVPFPINKPQHLFEFVPKDACFFNAIYDEWGERKMQILQDLGCKVAVVYKRPIGQKKFVGSELREAIRSNREWEHLVPPAVADALKGTQMLAKIRE